MNTSSGWFRIVGTCVGVIALTTALVAGSLIPVVSRAEEVGVVSSEAVTPTEIPVEVIVEEPAAPLEGVVSEEIAPTEEVPVVSEEVVETTSAEAPVEESVVAAPAETPALSTDKDDYHPGELVTVFGSFFEPLQKVMVRIFGNSEVGDFFADISREVEVGADGSFSFTEQLDNFYRPIYDMTASALDGSLLAQLSFTDAPNASVDTFDQCANGTGSGPTCAWTNGNLNANNSVYQEEDATVQRLLLTGLANGSHTVTIEYDTTKGGKHAYDFLTDPKLSETWVTDANICSGLTAFPGCTSATVNVSPNIPLDPLNVSGTVDTNQNIEIRNGTITAISAPTLVSGSYAGDSTTKVNVTFTVNTATCLNGSGSGANAECPALLTWGAHVSSQADWGTNSSAVNISGSPYHVRVTALDGKSTGNRDNQMSASVIPSTIIIRKVTANGDTATSFNFTTTGTGYNGFALTSGTQNSQQVSSGGTFTATESATAGWALANIQCSVTGSGVTATPNVAGRSVSIAISNQAAGGNVVDCTFTNAPATGHLVVVKDALPNDAQDFTFTNNFGNGNPASFDLDDDSDNALANSRDSIVTAGTYSISEGAVAGWTQTSATCSDGSPINAVQVSAGETVTCTFVNTKKGHITIEKQTLPDGDTADFNFTGDVSGTLSDGESVTVEVAPGTYTSTEGALAGWDLAGISCNDSDSTVNVGTRTATVKVAAGEDVKCTFLNTKRGTLTLVKNSVGGDGSFAFTLGGGLAPATPTLTTVGGVGSATYNNVIPGKYSAAETVPGGWDLTSAVCDSGETIADIDIEAGENVTCTFTNTKKPTLTLVKTVVNDNGGDAEIGDFAGHIDGTAVAWGTPTLVTVGAHTATETSLPGYAASVWGGDCATDGSITLLAGENKTCTITNDDEQAYITVVKVVHNDHGGAAVPDDFNLTLEGDTVASGVAIPVNPGTYTAAETLLAGYEFNGFSGDCDETGEITVALGENKTCTLTNTDKQSYVIVNKTVVNDNGGEASPNDFLLTVDDASVIDEVAYPVMPGVHTAGETLLTGYTAGQWGGDCATDGTVTVPLGETKTCTITNDDDAPSLTLVKQVVNDNGGTAVASDWVLTAEGYDTLSPDAGTYALTESDGPDGYTQTSLTCDNVQGEVTEVTLGLGEDVTCTFVNDDRAPHLHLRKVVINDNGGTKTAADFTLSADGTSTNDLSGTSPVDSDETLKADTWTLSEAAVPGYSASSWVCDGGEQSGATITLGLGEEATCTITNNDQPGQVKLIKNTVGGEGTFNFSIAGPTAGTPSITTVAGAGDTGLIEVNAGVYSASETVPAGWDLTGSSCDSGTPASFTVENGGTVTCTFTNTKRATLTIVKDAQPNDLIDFSFGGTLGSFLLDDDEGVADVGLNGDIDQPNSKTFTGLVPGAQTVTETQPNSYWKLKSATCVETGTTTAYPATLTGTSLALTLGAGKDVTCTFVNEKLSPTRTLGFWQTHLTYTNGIFGSKGPFFIGENVAVGAATHKGILSSVGQVLGAFYASIPKTTDNKQRNAVDKARITLLQQLMAAKLNCQTFGCAQGVKDLITAADTAFKNGDLTALQTLTGQLDAYNNSGDTVTIGSAGKADPKGAKAAAILNFWDKP